MGPSDVILTLLGRVRHRLWALRLSAGILRTAAATSGTLLGAVLLAHVVKPGLALVWLSPVLGLAVLAAGLWGVAALRSVPSDVRIARLIEEHVPALDDRLASAVDLMRRGRDYPPPALADLLLADAAVRARGVDVNSVVSAATLRRAASRAAAAVLALVAVVAIGRDVWRQTYDSLRLALFPSRTALNITPGDVRVKAGAPLTIEAVLVGNRAPVVPRVEIQEGTGTHVREMTAEGAGRFRLRLDAVASPFVYRVAAQGAHAGPFAVAVSHPPHVLRIDLDYKYPPALGLPPRSEDDGGDIYAPAGTEVRLHVHSDRPTASGRLAFADGQAVALTPESAAVVGGAFKVLVDGSYHVTLDDPEGGSDTTEAEYFVRMLAERPPDVHVLKPAGDRVVTRLEEVDIEAQADADYGVSHFDLVYAVQGEPEHVLPFTVPARARSVTGHQTLYLEDLNLQTGELVVYYVRAGDLTHGAQSKEARSDIFFLEVRPFEQEFSLAQSQSMAGSGSNGAIEGLVTAQKQVVVATWKLDRRAEQDGASALEQDAHSVARAEAELKSRVEQVSSQFHQTTMRDPRAPSGQNAVGGSLPEEDAMTAASREMGQAVASLDGMQTGEAISPEMQALTHLMKAQSDTTQRQISLPQSGAGAAGNNNRNYDVSTLFDKELQRQQETNYETPTNNTGPRTRADVLDRVRELAQRQDELNREQQQLARDEQQLAEQEVKRRLEQLTRDQTALRQRAEDLAKQMAQSSPVDGTSPPPQGSSQTPSGGTSTQPGASQSGSPGQSAPTGGQASATDADRLREVSEAMGNATSDLRRQDPGQASASGSRALQKLQELEQRLDQDQPDEPQRAIGDMQLEARQLAEAERHMAGDIGNVGQTADPKDAFRRFAGQQYQLADRARRLQQTLKRAASPPTAGATDQAAQQTAQAAAGDATQELEQARVPDRMQQAADALNGAAGNASGGPPVTGGGRATTATPGVDARQEQEIARMLDRLADTLTAGLGSGRSGDSQKLSAELAHAKELRARLDDLGRRLQEAADQNGQTGTQASGNKAGGGSGASQPLAPQSDSGDPSQLAGLREEYMRQLGETEQLLNQIQRDAPDATKQLGAGFTFEGQGMVLSAPGTEAFKRDFGRWLELEQQATAALASAEAQLSRKLQTKQSSDRLAAGTDDKAPPEYRDQVDAYFKALAAKQQP